MALGSYRAPVGRRKGGPAESPLQATGKPAELASALKGGRCIATPATVTTHQGACCLPPLLEFGTGHELSAASRR